jgi:hypothetical protein
MIRQPGISLELKACAEFFEYKVLRLLLSHQMHDFPADAVTQFNRHIKFFSHYQVLLS